VGRHRPVLAAGRDGQSYIPMRSGGYEEASTARHGGVLRSERGSRLALLFGQNAGIEANDVVYTLTQFAYGPRRCKIGTARCRVGVHHGQGSACDEYYHRVLKENEAFRVNGSPLAWVGAIFWHVCSYIR